MRPKTLVISLLILGLIFVIVGDRFLPQPLSNVSQNTRKDINQFMISLFPQSNLKQTIRQRNQQTRDLIEKKEKPQSN
jgi:hypothetical protein